MLYRVFLNIALLCAGTLTALTIAELLARGIHPLSTVEYRMDNDVGPVLVPYQKARWVSKDYDVEVVTNSMGFHDVEHVLEKPEGSYRIVVLGDSYIEALQVPVKEGFTQRLEHILEGWMKEEQAEVLNLGVSGSGPGQYYRILEKKGLAYKPDLVLMAVLPDNDFRDSSRSLSGTAFKPYYSIRVDGTLEYLPPQASELGVTMRFILRRSAFLSLARQAIVSMPIERWLANLGFLAPASGVMENTEKSAVPTDWYVYVAGAPEPWPDAYRLTLRMIKESKELAERHGARFLVMLIATPATVQNEWKEVLRNYPGADRLSWDFDKPYRAIKSLGEQSGFDVISLVEPFQQDYHLSGISRSWAHDGHWNPEGHRLAAEAIGSYLREHRSRYKLTSSPR